MCKVSCKICNKTFSAETEYSAKGNLSKHVRKEHELSKRDFFIQYENNGVIPLCACGCGNETKINKLDKANKFYKDHKNKQGNKYTDEQKLKLRRIRSAISKQRIELNKDIINPALNEWKNLVLTRKQIEQKYNTDLRTFFNWWQSLGLISYEEIQAINRKHKFHWSSKSEKRKQAVEGQLLLDIYKFIKENKNNFTLNEIVNKFSCTFSPHILYKRLKETFKDIDDYFKGLSSKSEIEFGNILVYYFGKKNIKKQFRLEKKIYDFCLLDKLIIEFDGEFYHNSEVAKENDKRKDEIALRNNFIIFRVKYSERKNIEILKKINNIVYEIQTCTNNKN